MDQASNLKNSNNKDIKDPFIAENIEILLQKMNNKTIPSIIFEYIANKDVNFEINDLKNFYASFGEVIDFIIKGKLSIVLYKTFFSANACREFLLNENNFKDNMKKNFFVRWFDYEKDISILPSEMKKIFIEIHNKNLNNLKEDNLVDKKNIIFDKNQNENKIKINNINLNNDINYNNIFNINNSYNQYLNNIIGNQIKSNNYLFPNLNMDYNQIEMNQKIPINNNINKINDIRTLEIIRYLSNLNELKNKTIKPFQPNIPFLTNNQFNNGINNNINIINDLNINNINNINNFQYIQKKNNLNSYNINQNLDGEKNYGRYTCKYQILIPNDKDFQIARRIIGNKGYEMKKILNECKNNNVKDLVKLRLRGKGSGYLEGPENQESDEPLHLCISTKDQEEMDKVCKLVDNLLNKIYEDYKNYCFKNNIFPIVNQIAIRIEEGNSFQK